jgi:phage-related protein/predicted XRE-type DNA-binding protein
MSETTCKPLHFVASSRRDLSALPEDVQDVFGAALLGALRGEVSPNARAFGEGLPGRVLKLAQAHHGDTYRLAYTVAFPRAVYVLHAFKRKSPKRIGTPLRDIELVRARLRGAAEHYQEHYHTWGDAMSDDTTVHDSTGNVFADMGLADAETRLAKAELARALRKALEERGLDHGAAAELLAIGPPDLSDLTCGKLGRFSLERLEGFLDVLDVEPAPR